MTEILKFPVNEGDWIVFKTALDAFRAAAKGEGA